MATLKFRVFWEEDLSKVLTHEVNAAAQPEKEISSGIQLQSNQPLQDQLEAFLATIEVKKPPTDYVFQCAWNGRYLVDGEPLEPQLSGAQSVSDANQILYLKIRRGRLADEVLNLLTDWQGNSMQHKSVAFRLKSLLEDENFAEEFFARDGMDLLLEIVSGSSGNLKTYAMNAFRVCMMYVTAIELLAEHPGLVELIYGLIDEEVRKTSPALCRYALETLFIFVNYSEKAFDILHQVIIVNSQQKGIGPYSEIVTLLSSNDADIQLNSMILINCLLLADQETNATDLLPMLEAQNIIGYLKKIVENQMSHLIQTQMEFFQKMTGITVIGSDGSSEETDYFAILQRRKKKVLKSSEVEKLENKLQEERRRTKLLDQQLDQRNQELQSLRSKVIQLEKALEEYTANEMTKQTYGELKKDATMIGPLFKRRKRKDWKPRYFLVKEKHIVYFEISNMKDIPKDNQMPKGVWFIRWIKFVDSIAETEFNRKFCFFLKVKSEQQFLSTNSTEETEKWIQGFRDARDRIKLQIENEEAVATFGPVLGVSSSQSLVKNESDDTESTSSVPSTPTGSKSLSFGVPEEKSMLSAQSPSQSPFSQPPSESKKSGGDPIGPASPPPPPTVSGGPPPPPPPFAGGGPPPPPLNLGGPAPPPFGLGSSAQSNLPKMKPLFWKKVAIPTKNDTYWFSLPDVKFDTSKYEEKFSLSKPANAGNATDNLANKNDSSKKQFVRVLDMKKSQKVAIMKSSLPPDDALLQCFDQMEGLNVDQLNQLVVNFPTDEEIQEISSVSGQETPLDVPEAFFLTLSKIPHIKERLGCWLFMISFEDMEGDIRPRLTNVMDGILQVRNSSSLKWLLKTTLLFGNFLNQGNPSRGQAQGFQLSILDRLDGTKDNFGVSLLDHIIAFAFENNPSIQNIVTELDGVKFAGQMTFEEIRANFLKLRNEHKSTVAAMESIGKAFNANHPFNLKLKSFLPHATEVVSRLENDIKLMESEYMKLLNYLAIPVEDLKDYPVQEFFPIISRFVMKMNLQLDKLIREKNRLERRKSRPVKMKGKIQDLDKVALDSMKLEEASSNNKIEKNVDAESNTAVENASADYSNKVSIQNSTSNDSELVLPIVEDLKKGGRLMRMWQSAKKRMV